MADVPCGILNLTIRRTFKMRWLFGKITKFFVKPPIPFASLEFNYLFLKVLASWLLIARSRVFAVLFSAIKSAEFGNRSVLIYLQTIIVFALH